MLRVSFSFALGDEAEAGAGDDDRYGCPGAWLTVSASAAPFLVGASLDYGARLRPPRFRVLRNPNVEHTCPCRRSFGSTWPSPRQPDCRSYGPMPWDDDYQPPREWVQRTGWTPPDRG